MSMIHDAVVLWGVVCWAIVAFAIWRAVSEILRGARRR